MTSWRKKLFPNASADRDERELLAAGITPEHPSLYGLQAEAHSQPSGRPVNPTAAPILAGWEELLALVESRGHRVAFVKVRVHADRLGWT